MHERGRSLLSPLGAGGHSVRFNGKVSEALVSFRERRRPLDLCHSALLVHLPEGVFAIESAPCPTPPAPNGVRSPEVLSAIAGRGCLRIFGYEVDAGLVVARGRVSESA
jgi:hypothetical protein